MCTYHVIADRAVYARLRKELIDAFPDPEAALDCTALEKLTYLTAVIKETLRISYGTVFPVPRVVPAGGMTLSGHYFAEGVCDT
jgi:hypothetical protein